MKRCIKWLNNKFVKWGRKESWEEKIGLVIGALLGIISSIATFIDIKLLLDNAVVSYGHTEKLICVFVLSLAMGWWTYGIISIIVTDLLELISHIIKKLKK